MKYGGLKSQQFLYRSWSLSVTVLVGFAQIYFKKLMFNQLSISTRRTQSTAYLNFFSLLAMDPYIHYDLVGRTLISRIDEWTTHPSFPISVFAGFFAR